MFLVVFIEDQNDSNEEEGDDEKDTVSNSRRASKLDKTQQKSSPSSTKMSWKSSTESFRVACQTCTESNAAVDCEREEDMCLHKPILHISIDDEADQKGKETAV